MNGVTVGLSRRCSLLRLILRNKTSTMRLMVNASYTILSRNGDHGVIDAKCGLLDLTPDQRKILIYSISGMGSLSLRNKQTQQMRKKLSLFWIISWNYGVMETVKATTMSLTCSLIISRNRISRRVLFFH